MARNSVKHLFRLFGLHVKGFHSAGQFIGVGALAKETGGITTKFSRFRSNGVGAFYKHNCTSGNKSCVKRGVQQESRILGYNRGLQSLSGELLHQGGRVASSQLSKSSFFSAAKSLGRRGVLKAEFSLKDPSGARGWRSYYVDKQGVQHFKRRGPAAWSETVNSQRSRTWIIGVVVIGGIIYVMNLETVPYTRRKHFVLVSPAIERAIGDRGFKMLLKEYNNRILPPNHPETVRVHKISGEVIEALMLGTKASDWGELEKIGDDHPAFGAGAGWDTVTRKSDAPLLGASYADHAHSHDDTIDEGWVDQSRKKGLQKGEEGFKEHLEGMQWQVIVVDDDIVNAVCLPGGKIVVFTGLLKKFRSAPEIATVVAHEVGHAVARHSAESLTQNLFLVAFQLAVLSVFYVPSLVNSVSELIFRLPFSRRMEIEADHIGLILMAAAGYDPRLAPAFYEKLASIENAPEFAQYLSTHPSGKKRGEKLRNTATMEEAMRLYRQKMAGRGAEGFF